MAKAALICTLVYWLNLILDPYLLSWQCLNRPIVVAPLIGLALGDFTTGVIMGASLEAIFMGISAVGGSVPSDATSATVISVAYVILANGDIETGLALALPIGVIMIQIQMLIMPLLSALAPYWEREAMKAKPTNFLVKNLVFSCIITPLPKLIVMYLGIAFGVDGLQSGLAKLPTWVMTGLGASSSMMVAVGFAILCSMIWSGRLSVFFFVGFVLSKILNMDSLSIAIIGTAIAVTMFFADKDFIEFKNSLNAKKLTTANDEEDFF